MDDLISRQAAIDAIIKAFDRGTLLNSLVRKVAVDAVKVLPSAVVRCKDCRWCKDLDENGWCWCGNDGYGMPLDGFCSYGERKDGDSDDSEQ